MFWCSIIITNSSTKFIITTTTPRQQKVPSEKGRALAAEYGIKFFETSAKQNINVDEAFLSIAKDIVDRLKENPDHYGSTGGAVYVNGETKNKEKASCC